MEWVLISLGLALVYTLYILFSQCLMTKFKIKSDTIFVNIICIAALLCILLKPHELMVPQANLKYGILFLIGVVLFFQNYFLQLGTESIVNMGVIDGFAICVYLPLTTLLLYLLFGEKVTYRKAFGIILACIAGYFILT
jgi:drug/metabolite transporter (DMT)-like permease